MPERFRDKLGQLVGNFDLEELTAMLLRSGVAPGVARVRAAGLLGLADPLGSQPLGALGDTPLGTPAGGHLSEKVTGDSFMRSPPSRAREKIHMHRMDQLVTVLRGRVYRLSQSRATKQSLGLMDRIYVFAKLRRWYSWEAKAEDGRVRAEQAVFAAEAVECGIPHVVGTYGVMRKRLVADGVCPEETGVYPYLE